MLKLQQIGTKGQVENVKNQDKFEWGDMASEPLLSQCPFSKHKYFKTLVINQGKEWYN